jgi:predicted nucleotidyltransferase
MNVEHFIMFGSRARGDELLTSDVDLIVVSEGFQGKQFRQRPVEVLEHWPDVVDLEVLCYTPEEFAMMKERLGTVRRAIAEGIEV